MNNKMKNHQYKLIILSLVLLTSLGAQAGNVGWPDFIDGDTLSAGQMNEVKDSVNDNDTRVTTNNSAIESLFSGDGSAGDLTVSGPVNWSSTPPVNPNFANISIDAGQFFTVPAGTTIHCSGTFTNNGTLQVLTGASMNGAQTGLNTTTGATGMVSADSHPGDTPGGVTLGTYNNVTTSNLSGGGGGEAISEAVTVTSFSSFRIGGASGTGYANFGQEGGGLVKIYCSGAILNATGANINARGGSSTPGGNSGGGGGIVVLASRTSINNAGVIDVAGGNGASSSTWAGNSGGGGGGIIVMISPNAPVPGTDGTNTIISGGLGGTGNGPVTTAGRMAGSGGGGSGGNGGHGGLVLSGTTAAAPNGGNGGDGYIVTMTLDPITVAR